MASELESDLRDIRRGQEVAYCFQYCEKSAGYDWTPKTIFLNILQKYYGLHILGNLEMSGQLHQKRYCLFVETLMFICMQKMNSILNFVFEIL